MRGNDIYSAIDDMGLLRLIQQNDQMAFTELYNRYSSVLYLFILFYIKDEELSRDTLQHIFMTLWEQRHRITVASSVRSYLHTAAKNHVLNQIRARKVRLQYNCAVRDSDNDDARLPSPEEIYERDEMNRLIELAISDLRHEKKQQIIELRRSGLSNREVAQQLGIPENTVRTYYAQSLRALREHFKKLFITLATLCLDIYHLI